MEQRMLSVSAFFTPEVAQNYYPANFNTLQELMFKWNGYLSAQYGKENSYIVNLLYQKASALIRK